VSIGPESSMSTGIDPGRKSVQEMLGEFLREAGVLVLVFGFLDLYMTERPVTFWFAIGILSLSGFLLVSGILAEITRRD
jgi:hypothetical protein